MRGAKLGNYLKQSVKADLSNHIWLEEASIGSSYVINKQQVSSPSSWNGW